MATCEHTSVYLPSFYNFEQDDWDDWLDVGEYAYNSSEHATTEITPFYGNQGRHPRSEIKPEEPGEPLEELIATMHAN
jgi:hypothetical protein